MHPVAAALPMGQPHQWRPGRAEGVRCVPAEALLHSRQLARDQLQAHPFLRLQSDNQAIGHIFFGPCIPAIGKNIMRLFFEGDDDFACTHRQFFAGTHIKRYPCPAPIFNTQL